MSPTPAACLAALYAGLKNIRTATIDQVSFLALTADTPVPVRILGADQAAEGSLTDDPAIYRFFIRVNGKAMLADLDIDAEGGVSLNSVLEGEGAELFETAFEVLGSFLETSDERFKLSVIEVPALHEIALWLQGSNADFILEVLRRGELAERSLIPLVQYVAELSDDASRSYIFTDATLQASEAKNDGPDT
jgi:hypothetical protein